MTISYTAYSDLLKLRHILWGNYYQLLHTLFPLHHLGAYKFVFDDFGNAHDHECELVLMLVHLDQEQRWSQNVLCSILSDQSD